MPSNLRIAIFGCCALFKIHRLEDGVLSVLLFSQWTLAEYAEILESNGWKNPLTQEEIAQADKEVFEAEALEAQLQSVAENSRAEDFSQTTQGIKEGDLNPELDEELEYTDEGWSMDDWE